MVVPEPIERLTAQSRWRIAVAFNLLSMQQEPTDSTQPEWWPEMQAARSNTQRMHGRRVPFLNMPSHGPPSTSTSKRLAYFVSLAASRCPASTRLRKRMAILYPCKNRNVARARPSPCNRRDRGDDVSGHRPS
jgi:hypothetical protein